MQQSDRTLAGRLEPIKPAEPPAETIIAESDSSVTGESPTRFAATPSPSLFKRRLNVEGGAAE